MRFPRLSFLLSLCSLSIGCASFPGSGSDPRPRDEILWTAATRALDRQRCDVGRITLQTLINTYPDSRYAHEAEDALRTDSRLQPCREVTDTGSTTWSVGAPDVTN